jgi:hypothetical protein
LHTSLAYKTNLTVEILRKHLDDIKEPVILSYFPDHGSGQLWNIANREMTYPAKKNNGWHRGFKTSMKECIIF